MRRDATDHRERGFRAGERGGQSGTLDAEPQSFDRVLCSMCTRPHPAARRAAERFLATNPGDPTTFPAVAELEERAIEALGAVASLPDPAGYVTSGGTEANVQAVRMARDRHRDLTAGPGPSPAANVVAPESAHVSVRKAADLLGVELRTVPTREGRADLDALSAAVDRGTVAVVAVAGSTEYGRVDPVPAVAEIASDAGALCHVDAAWGGFELPFTDHDWDFGDAPVDTMTLDPHKLGRAAVPSGGLLVRDPGLLERSTVETPYMGQAGQATLLGTRSGAGVASAVAALERLWPDGYRRQQRRIAATAAWLAGELRDRSYDVVDPELSVVVADLPRETVEALRAAGWRLATTGAGELRVVCGPHLTRATLEEFLGDLDRVVDGESARDEG